MTVNKTKYLGPNKVNQINWSRILKNPPNLPARIFSLPLSNSDKTSTFGLCHNLIDVFKSHECLFE